MKWIVAHDFDYNFYFLEDGIIKIDYQELKTLDKKEPIQEIAHNMIAAEVILLTSSMAAVPKKYNN